MANEQNLRELLDEVEELVGNDGDVSEVEDHQSVSSHEIDTEEEPDDKPSQAAQAQPTGLDYVARDGSRWWRRPPPLDCTNITVRFPTPTRRGREKRSPRKCWDLFIDSAIINEIVDSTNIKIRETRGNYSHEPAETTNSEIYALLGLLYMCGVHHAGRINITELYAQDGSGIAYFRMVMSEGRFRFLLRMLRFDDINTRRDRREHDKMAALRSIFTKFVENCKSSYSVGDIVTVDEMLIGFRGRCPFRQYLPRKPAKYGIKIFGLVDARTYYTYNLEVYLGWQPDGEFRLDNRPIAIVKRLVAPISGSGRNIVLDNWLTSVPLAEDLKNEHNLTITGTLRLNKASIPSLFIQKISERQVQSSMFGHSDIATLISYRAKKKKFVALLTSHPSHQNDNINEEDPAMRPEAFSYYNRNKNGVDEVERLQAMYAVNRNSRRWPLTIFFALLNIASINAFVIYRSNTENDDPRRNFLKQLSRSLVYDHVRNRLNYAQTPRDVKDMIRTYFPPRNDDEAEEEMDEEVKGRCYYCARAVDRKNRKTRFRCFRCSKFICLKDHADYICTACVQRRSSF